MQGRLETQWIDHIVFIHVRSFGIRHDEITQLEANLPVETQQYTLFILGLWLLWEIMVKLTFPASLLRDERYPNTEGLCSTATGQAAYGSPFLPRQNNYVMLCINENK